MRVRRLENKSEVHDTSNRGVKPQQNGICQASTEPPPMGRPRSLAHRVVARTVCSCTVKLYRVLGTPPAGLLDKVNQLYDDRFDRRTGFFWGRPSRENRYDRRCIEREAADHSVDRLHGCRNQRSGPAHEHLDAAIATATSTALFSE